MKHTILQPLLSAALMFGAFTATLPAQAPAPDASASPGPPVEHHGPPPGHHGPPPSPLFRALDTNGDGVISADEIANASAALKTLAGTSGQITRESLRPLHPPQDEHRQGGDEGPRPHHPPPPDAAPDDGPGSPAPRPARADASPAPEAPPAAAGGPPGHRHHGPPPGDRLFDMLDTNGDGVISADEMAAAATALKKAANRDGVIDRRDFRPPPPPPAPAD